MTTNPTTPGAPLIPGDLFARHQIITGLRQLADFLEDNPAVPVPEYGWDVSYHVRRGDDDTRRAEVDRIAALLGARVDDDTDDGGHCTTALTLGRITYRAIHIPSRARADYQARTSYQDNITLDDPGQAA